MERKLFLYSTILAAIALIAPAVAHADDVPFQFDQTNWMSFQRYKEDPSAWQEEKQTEAPSVAQAPVFATPVIVPQPVALPVLNRPLNVPSMPGLNKGFQVDVASTFDSKRLDTPTTDPDDPDALEPPPDKWKNAVAEAQNAHNSKSESDDGVINIRFATLPNPEVTPVFNPPRKKYERPKPPQVAQTPIPDQKDQAACAAIDAYKKRELAAIESDRRTLAALQSAVGQLGLEKQLDFMVGANGSVTQPAQNANMDFAITAPTSAKN